MILYRNRLIFGLIRNIIVTIFTIILKILDFFSLQFTLLIALIGLILFLTGAFENPIVLLIFQIILVISIIYAIVGTIRKTLGIEKGRSKRKNGAQIVKQQKQEYIEQAAYQKEEPTNNSVNQSNIEQGPKYYNVKNHSGYIMAEYSDRVELYRKTESGLKKIRTDYK